MRGLLERESVRPARAPAGFSVWRKPISAEAAVAVCANLSGCPCARLIGQNPHSAVESTRRATRRASSTRPVSCSSSRSLWELETSARWPSGAAVGAHADRAARGAGASDLGLQAGKPFARVRACGPSRATGPRWNPSVNGQRLPPGHYLITLRALGASGHVIALSAPVKITIHPRETRPRLTTTRGDVSDAPPLKGTAAGDRGACR